MRGRTILQERLWRPERHFGLLALVLVSAGIYGLCVRLSLRRKEIGIRMALGADARQMARRIVRSGLVLTAIGLAVGLAGRARVGAAVAQRAGRVSPYDPLAIAAACCC